MPGRNEFFRRGIKNGNIYYWLQFGGASTDEIHDIKVLSTGDIIVFGRTLSTTFCGMDISAYTNGTYYAWFMLKIDKEFWLKPGYSWLLGSYFITGNGKTCNIQSYWWGQRPATIEIDGSENIFYVYGDSATGWQNKTGWKIYGVRSSDMTLQYTADTAVTVQCLNDTMVPIQHKLYSGTWYVVYGDGTKTKLQKLNGSLVQTASADLWTNWDVNYNPLNTVVCAGGIFTWNHSGGNAGMMKKCTLAGVFERDSNITGGAGSVSGIPAIAYDATHIYCYHIQEESKTIYNKVTQATLANTYGGTISPAAGKVNRLIGVRFDSAGRLWLSGYTNDGAVGALDPKVYEINPATGAVISGKLLKYKSGVSIGTVGVDTLNYVGPVDLLDGKKVWPIRLWGALEGYANLGGQDCGIFVTDADGIGLA